jgi:hypothetical protein
MFALWFWFGIKYLSSQRSINCKIFHGHFRNNLTFQMFLLGGFVIDIWSLPMNSNICIISYNNYEKQKNWKTIVGWWYIVIMSCATSLVPISIIGNFLVVCKHLYISNFDKKI